MTRLGPTDRDALRDTIRQVRRRWRLRVALRGAAIVLAAALAVFAFSAWGLDQLRFAGWAVTLVRILAYAAVAVAAALFLVRPLVRRVRDEEVALYVEEHEPSLQAALLSAVDAAGHDPERRAESRLLVERLISDAVERCAAIEGGRRVERTALRRAGAMAGIAGAGALGLALLAPGLLRQAAPFLLAPWGGARAASPYAIEVSPGHVAVARGADQVVIARLRGFESEEVEIASRAGAGEWMRSPMTAEADGGHRFILLDLSSPTEYFVEASGVRSAVFRIDVQDLPYVRQIDLEYRFPAYTGLSPRTVEDGGDIAALKGTEVRLKVFPTVSVAGGRLVVEGRPSAPLALESDGSLTGLVQVVREGFYKVELARPGGAPRAASPDYAIEVLDDQPPAIAFVKPGRDTRVTPIEEVFTEVRAEDDYGVERLELVYSVNGGPEQTVSLRQGAPRREVSAGHTFFLEEMELQPGDFVSYYARAKDANRVGGPGSATTDIYFMEARPFGREYRQAAQRGQAGGGGEDGALSQRQREIVAATFKVVRDAKTRTEKQVREDLATLSMIQGRLKEQVDNLVMRMGTRGILETAPEFAGTAESLKKASAEMEAARDLLGAGKAKEALPPEQRALQHLQRAEAAFRDVQVSFGNPQGGGGSAAEAEDLADLFELELDKLRNQYETVQRAENRVRDEAVDEALQRLTELARRQQQENERMRALAGMPSNQGSGGGQAQLAEQARELARQLERLAREKPSSSLQDSARRLREAADAMRRSAAGGKDGALSEGIAALDQLKAAQRQLENSRETRLDRDVEDAVSRARALREQQEKIASEVDRLEAGGDRNRLQRLLERKDALAGEVRDLETQLDRMARDTRRTHKEASRRLSEAAEGIRESRLQDKIRYSKGVVRGRPGEYAKQFEGQISSDIEELERRVQEAATAAGKEPAGDRMAGALDKTRELVRNLESLDERMRQAREGGGREASRAGASPGPGASPGSGASPRPGTSPGPGGSPGPDAPERADAGGAGEPGGEDRAGERGRDGRRERPGQGPQGAEGPGDAGARGGVITPGGVAPGAGIPGPWGRYTQEEVRQFRREFRERLREAQELARQLGHETPPGVDLGEVMRGLRALEGSRPYGDPRGLDQLRGQVLEDVKMFEYALRRAVEGEGRDKLFLAAGDEVPPGWKALVEEYYRSLARRR